MCTETDPITGSHFHEREDLNHARPRGKHVDIIFKCDYNVLVLMFCFLTDYSADCQRLSNSVRSTAPFEVHLERIMLSLEKESGQ